MKLLVFNAKWHQAIFKYRRRKNYIQKTLLLCFFPIAISLKILRKICRRKILSSSSYSKKEIKTIGEIFSRNWFSEEKDQNSLGKWYHASLLRLITPDGVSLSGIYFKHKKSDQNTPIILLFQSSGALAKHTEYEWLLDKAGQYDHVANFITMDYRGCGESLGKAHNLQELILDGDTLYQFVKDVLKVPDDNIIFYGYSLGGSISAHVRSLYPERPIKYVNERSFSSLSQLIYTRYPKRGYYFSWIVKKLKWESNVLGIWSKLEGKKLIIYQPQDEVIPFRASLFYGLFSAKKHISSSLQLACAHKSTKIRFHHSAPLCYYVDPKNALCAEKSVIEFLFSKEST